MNTLQTTLLNLYSKEKVHTKVGNEISVNLAARELKLDVEKVSDDDLSVIVSFLNSREALLQIQKICICRISAHSSGKQVLKSQLAGSTKILRVLIEFIAKCRGLLCLYIESINISIEQLNRLGTSISKTKSELRWLSLKHCPIGDAGLNVMGPHLMNRAIQVLQLEYCNLTSVAIFQLSELIKVQGEKMDSLFWNATLRLNPHDDSGQIKSAIFSSGLVVLSVEGNHIGGEHIKSLAKALRINHWIIGLNFSHNNLTAVEVGVLVKTILNNCVLASLRLEGNPGYSSKVESVLLGGLSHSTISMSALAPDLAGILSSWEEVQQQQIATPSSLNASVVREVDRTPMHEAATRRRDVRNGLHLEQYRDEEEEHELVLPLDAIAGDEEDLYAMDFALPTSPASASALRSADWSTSFPRSSTTTGDNQRPPSRNSMRSRPQIESILASSHSSAPAHFNAALDLVDSTKLNRYPHKNSSQPNSAPLSRQRPATLVSQKELRRSTTPTRPALQASVLQRSHPQVKAPLPKTFSKTKSKLKSPKSSEKKMLAHINEAVGTMTDNLVAVSFQLRDVADSLVKSADLHRSTNSIYNTSLQNTSLRSSSAHKPEYSRRLAYGTDEGILSEDTQDAIDDEMLTSIIRQSLRKKLETFVNK